MIPVLYKLLLSNELILRKSEQQSDAKIRVYSNTHVFLHYPSFLNFKDFKFSRKAATQR